MFLLTLVFYLRIIYVLKPLQNYIKRFTSIYLYIFNIKIIVKGIA